MTVKFITCTPDIEKLMVHVARVSSPESQARGGNEAKLLKYCIKNGHWSVFQHGFATLEITTSRSIARQILRHSSFAVSEFSQRYSEVAADNIIIPAARKQDVKNRQNSTDTLDEDTKADWLQSVDLVWTRALKEYQYALSIGVAKECARALLPEGLTPSTLYISGPVRSFIHWINLRTGNGTQLEHQQIAEEAKQVLIPVLPILAEALGWVSNDS